MGETQMTGEAGEGQMSLEEIDSSFSHESTERKIDLAEKHQIEKQRLEHLSDILGTAKNIEFSVSKQTLDYEPFIDFFVNNTEEITDQRTSESHYYQLYKMVVESRLKNTFSTAQDLRDLADALEEIELPELIKERDKLEEEIDRMKDAHPSHIRDQKKQKFARLLNITEKMPFMIQFIREIR